MDDSLAIAYLWLCHAFITAPVVAPIVWFSRHRVQWRRWELVAFLLPFAVWLALIYTGGRPKTIANLGECFIISIGIGIAAMVRATLGRSSDSPAVPALLVAALTGVAAAAYYFTPMWPE